MTDEPKSDQPEESVRDEPTDPPEFVGTAIGEAGFAKREEAQREVIDNDEESHVEPSDNDGETVPG
jgi:hypothetical protein